MYENYWGLTSAPFRNRLEDQAFLECAVHEEALARMYYCIEQHKGLGVLHGPAGCGKSQLLRVLGQQIRRSQRFLGEVLLTGLEESEFLAQACRSLGITISKSDSRSMVWRRLTDFLRQTAADTLQTVLLLDGLEDAGASAVTAIRRLVETSYHADALLTVIASLNHGPRPGNLQALLDAADMGIDVRPLNRNSAESYVQNRLRRAGTERSVFESDAIDHLVEQTGGVPREINRLCDLALLAGMSEAKRTIDRDLLAGLKGENSRP